MAVTLQEMIDGITAGTRQEKEAFASIIVQAQIFLNNTQSSARDKAIADANTAMVTLLSSTVLPSLKTRNILDPLISQFDDIQGNVGYF